MNSPKYGSEEKVLLLGALFHDIGKFIQRCTDKSKTHPVTGELLVKEFEAEFARIVGKEHFSHLITIITQHHTVEPEDALLRIVQSADALSSSERVKGEMNEEGKENDFLCSLLSKIELHPGRTESTPKKYYNHQPLTKENYSALIPRVENQSLQTYSGQDLKIFKSELQTILQFYKSDEDFDTLVNLLLVLFDKWLWCIPDFTASPHTDISLFNHLKDVAGLSHAICKNKPEDKTLNLVIGDIPGIQEYIFGITNKKPAKILRGRSIFVQVLARNFASIFLKEFGLTECNLVMLAGGKFYIIAPNTNEFETQYKNATREIEDYLQLNFNYEMRFVAGCEEFDWEELKQRKTTFGDIIDRATENLNSNKYNLFSSFFFNDDIVNEQNFILPGNYITPADFDTNKIKCAVTDKPIREGRADSITVEKDRDDDETATNVKAYETVDKQVALEYLIGDEVVDNNLYLVLEANNLDIFRNKNTGDKLSYSLEKPDIHPSSKKVLINPTYDKLFNKENLNKVRNTLFLEVANSVTIDPKTGFVMDFGNLAKENNGAQYLTLLKGDVDNLGLTMAFGLTRDRDNPEDKRDLTAISRTTTLSNHLKYFFGFYLNGFLQKWEEDGKEEVEKKLNDKNDKRVYTVFAGGDDVMLVCPQSSSLELLNELNKKFNEFACSNLEVHISYSLTNFKSHTPMRIVADMAEENQEKAKKKFKNAQQTGAMLDEKECFFAQNNKSGTYLFDTAVKNNRLQNLLDEKNKLVGWKNDENNPVTMGTIQNLLSIAEIKKEFWEKKDSSKLIWHPMLTYYINRNIKGNRNTTAEILAFFEKALRLEHSEETQMLYPILCETIYKLRK